jgi:uncharacterized protein (DUF4415 family)
VKVRPRPFLLGEEARMSGENIKRATLDEIEEMHRRGELYYNPDAPEGPPLSDEFWATAEVRNFSKEKRSVHLKLEPEVFDFFFREADGKGHLTKMQNVLKAYAKAHKAA